MNVECVTDTETVKYIKNIYANREYLKRPYSTHNNFNCPHWTMTSQSTTGNTTSLHHKPIINFHIIKSEEEEPTRNNRRHRTTGQPNPDHHAQNDDSGNIQTIRETKNEPKRENPQIENYNFSKKEGSICFSIVTNVPIKKKGGSQVMILPLDTLFQNPIEFEQQSRKSSFEFDSDSETPNMAQSEDESHGSNNLQTKTQNQNSFIQESKNNNQTSRQLNEFRKREKIKSNQKKPTSHVQFGDNDLNFQTKTNNLQKFKSKSNTILKEIREISKSRICFAFSNPQISPICIPR